jgi:riboflavin kinase/FMN adenylyltransferase
MSVGIVIGSFDAVHRGHQALLSHARECVGSDGRVVALTFHPHPTVVVAPTRVPPLLTDIDERIELLQDAGADQVVVVPFTEELSHLTPAEFVDQVLMPMHPTVICVGGNFRFGHGAAGDGTTLAELGAHRGFTTHAVPLTGATADSTPWSSTRARALIADGDVAAASQILGRNYRITGEVVHGDARGREIGFPTANIEVPSARAIPGDGVYAGWLDVRGEWHQAGISVGTNPHFEGTQRRIEAHALDVPAGFNIYGESAGITFVQRLRGQQVYAGLDELVSAIDADVQQVRTLLAARAVAQ